MKRNPILTGRARELRRSMTPAEVILWRELRGRRFAGWRFRRQQVIGQYIADFYCALLRIVIELDGESHIGRESQDRTRQLDLAGGGLLVLRFWNNEVYDEKEAVLEAIFETCRERAVAAPAAHP